MCICIKYVCISRCMYICINYVCLYDCMYVLYVCISKCMYVLYVFISRCMYVYMYKVVANMYVCTYRVVNNSFISLSSSLYWLVCLLMVGCGHVLLPAFCPAPTVATAGIPTGSLYTVHRISNNRRHLPIRPVHPTSTYSPRYSA